jgi:surface carbohydrate biosynthesis protein
MLKKKIDVIFLFEKASRELDIICFLKIMLEEKKISVEIVQQNTQSKEAIHKYIPKVVVLPFCYQNRSNNQYFRHWRAAKYISLNWEQFLYEGNKIAKTPRGNFATQNVIHCAWTEGYKALLKDCGVKVENIKIIGSLPLSILDQKYKDYIKNKDEISEKYNIESNKKWIFFPENFGWAFYEKNMLDQMINDGQHPNDVMQMKKFSTKSFYESMKWINKLIQEKDVIVILRPRPATSILDVEKKLLEFSIDKPKNLYIIKELTVKDWIHSSDIVVSSYSTTLIEAAVLNKNVLMLTPLNLPDILTQIWHPYVQKCKTYEELAVEIENQEIINYDKVKKWVKEYLNLDLNPLMCVEKEIIKCIKSKEKSKIKICDLIVGEKNIENYIKYWLGIIKFTATRLFPFYFKKPVDKEYIEDLESLSTISMKEMKIKKILKVT